MSKMLVAYESCGCRVAALLECDDAGVVESFEEDALVLDFEVREEEHASIGARRCAKHATATPAPVVPAGWTSDCE